MTHRSFLFLLIVAAFGHPAPAQTEPSATALKTNAIARDTVLHSADLRADLAVLQRAYETLHPGLYRYSTQAQVRSRFKDLDTYFSTDRTLAEAFLALTRLTASIKCGHSYPNFYNQTDSIAEALFEGRDKLPFAFRWISGRMIVTDDRSPKALPRGTAVLSINGVDTSKILESLMPLARADGGNDAKRVAYLEVRGEERYFAFDILYPLVFPVHEPSFTLVVRRPGARVTETVQVPALDGAERRAAAASKTELAPDVPLWSFEEHDGVGVLRMPTWALYNTKWDYRAWMETLIADLVTRNVSDLVVDLRDNEGGVAAGNQILAHLIDQPLRLPRYQRHVRYRRVPEDLVPVLDTWDPSFLDWGAAAIDSAYATFYRVTTWDDEEGSEIVKPAAPRYRGRVWVLVGAVNSSATFQFALAVKQSGVAKLIGQSTGGNRRGINGSAFFFVRLPKTGLEVDLPLVAGFPDTPQPDAGVLPDVVVKPSIADIAAGIDSELAAARSKMRHRAVRTQPR